MLKIYKIIIFSFLIISCNILIGHQSLASNDNLSSGNNNLESFQLVLPKFMQNFINNTAKISVEEIAPQVQKSDVGKLMNNPMSQQTQSAFFGGVRNWMIKTSQKMNDFLNVDVGNIFSKIMNLFIYYFNKAMVWIEELFK